MAISISDAARWWSVRRETIYRRHRSGELSFATAAPPTVDPAEMVRVFGEPRPNAPEASGDDVTPSVRVEAELDTLKGAADRLMAELAVANANSRAILTP